MISKLPLDKLITPNGEATRVRDVGSVIIRELLRTSPVRFVIANVGESLRWIPEAACYGKWKHEVQPHLAEPNQSVFLDDFPGGYAYFASEWTDGAGPIIVLEKSH